MTRKPYPSDVTDDEWAYVAPYLTLMTEDAPQRDYDLREVFNGLRWIVRTGAQWRMSQQDQSAFVNFLQPITELGLPVTAVMSDKQRGLVPAIAEVFSGAKHSFCQTHYLGNAAEPISEADEARRQNE